MEATGEQERRLSLSYMSSLIVALCVFASSPTFASVQGSLEVSEVLAVGQVVSVKDGPEVVTMTTADLSKVWREPCKIVTFRPSAFLSGTLPSEVEVLVRPGNGRKRPFTERANHKLYLFSIINQRSNDRDPALAAFAYRSSFFHPRPLLTDRFDRSLPPLLRLADLLANQLDSHLQAPKGLPFADNTLKWLQEATPMATSYRKALTTEEIQQSQRWLELSLKPRLDLSDPSCSMNFGALAMWWGLREKYAPMFMRSFKAMKGQGLAMRLPALISTDELVDLFPYISARDADDIARSLGKSGGSRRDEIAKVLIPRIDDYELVSAILTALSDLFSMPELAPTTQTGAYPTLPQKIARAKELFGG
jgi:hypothetical protein